MNKRLCIAGIRNESMRFGKHGGGGSGDGGGGGGGGGGGDGGCVCRSQFGA